MAKAGSGYARLEKDLYQHIQRPENSLSQNRNRNNCGSGKTATMSRRETNQPDKGDGRIWFADEINSPENLALVGLKNQLWS
jgi:hypothetical protein